jgi:hypothetical protein
MCADARASGAQALVAPLHLVLMSRAPVPGRTKTRLTPPLGPEEAQALHVACLNDLLAECRAWRAARLARGDVPPALHLFIDPPGSQAAFRLAGVDWPEDYALHNQRGETLGERMAQAIRRVLTVQSPVAGEPSGRVLLIGADLPLLTAAQLDEAAAALDRADPVFGPTMDGGYYLVGVRSDPQGLFDLQGWGGGTVLERSLAAARARGLRPALITPLPDVDTAADLAAVLSHPLAASLAGRRSLRLIRTLQGRLERGGPSDGS